MEDDYIQRFGGIGRLYGSDALPRLQRAHVAVIGVGGVGSWAVEALARSGVGKLTLIDADDVCITNTNRQLPALDGSIGRPKVEALAERARLINPACEVNAAAEFFLQSSADRLLETPYDFVLDCVDRVSIKALIIVACHQRIIPVITVGAAGGRRDPNLIRATDLGLAGQDELLRQLRRELRREHGFAPGTPGEANPMGIPCVFSPEKPVYPWSNGTCGFDREPESSLKLDCASGFGTATFITGVFGFIAAGEVVRRLALGAVDNPE